MTAKPRRMIHRRQTGQEHAASFARITRECERTLEHVARWQHAELVAKNAGTASAVEHRHHGVRVDPRIRFQSSKQARQTGASAEATHSHLAQTHGYTFYN